MANNDDHIRILIAINNRIICEGLKSVVASCERFRVACCSEPTDMGPPDILLIDCHIPPSKLSQFPSSSKKILLDSGLSEATLARHLVWHKIHGIIGPDTSVELFHKAIKSVYLGELWFEQSHLKSLLQRSESLTQNKGIRGLSQQDKKIIFMVAAGNRNRDIAESLCLSEHTIKAHISRILRELNLKNRAHIASLAKEYEQQSP